MTKFGAILFALLILGVSLFVSSCPETPRPPLPSLSPKPNYTEAESRAEEPPAPTTLQRKICPICGGANLVSIPIVYSEPTDAGLVREREGGILYARRPWKEDYPTIASRCRDCQSVIPPDFGD
ncbi:MAG: hypothetical protein NUW37_07685 [Planctomycetes bacterium]|nr:hypothetical protein [Planctomycetota bacterium]